MSPLVSLKLQGLKFIFPSSGFICIDIFSFACVCVIKHLYIHLSRQDRFH